MNKEDLLKYKARIAELSEEEKAQRNVYLRKLATGEIYGPQTGYSSIDMSWLKFYSEEGIQLEVPKKSMYQYFVDSVEKVLDTVAVDLRMGFNNFDKSVRKLTYREIIDEIVTIACGLKSYGFDENQILVEMLPNLVESRESIYAANAVGTTVYPISPMIPKTKYTEIIKDKKVKNVVMFNAFYDKFKDSLDNSDIEHIIYLNGLESMNPIMKQIALFKDKHSKENKFEIPKDPRIITWDDIKKAGKKYRKENGIKSYKDFETYYDPEHIAVIVGTSGTTGVSKGACLKDLAINASDFCEEIPQPIAPGEVFLDALIQSISYGLSIMHHTMCGGLYNYIIPEMVTDKIPMLLKKFKPDHFSGGPVHYENIIKSEEYQKGEIKHPKNFVSGGASLSKETEMKLNKITDKTYEEPIEGNPNLFVRQGLGATENTGTGIFTTKGSYKFGSVGVPIALSNCAIFKYGTDEEVLTGEVGEICLSGDTVMTEYYNNPEETAKVLKVHSDGTIWLHLGDEGYMDANGHVFMLDRYKNIFMRNGFNVHPLKIRDVINSAEFVEKSYVVGIEHPVEMCVPVAYVVLKPGVDPEVAEHVLNEMCFSRLDEYFVPYEYKFVDSLPMNLGGKVDQKQLLEDHPVDYSGVKVKKMNLR